MAGFITAAGASYLMGLAAMSVSRLDNYYLALTLDVPTPIQTSGELLELSNDDYIRSAIAATDDNWVLEQNTLSNALEVTFPVCEADWDGITGWALLDDPTDGEVLFGGDLGVPWTCPAGYQVVLTPGMLAVSIEVSPWEASA